MTSCSTMETATRRVTTDTNVLVLGGTGMLGSMLVDVFSRAEGIAVRATCRREGQPRQQKVRGKPVEWILFDAVTDEPIDLLVQQAWVFNAIGIIKPLIRESDPQDVRRAVVINSLFPYRLADAAAEAGARVIQIGTDCVYSGREGKYTERSPHDALDVYGKTKSLGEVVAPHVLNLRCSIVGPEVRGHRSLLSWFLGQPNAATIKGFANHLWNGLTTLHFAEIVLGLIRRKTLLAGTYHLIPADTVSKAQLLAEFASAFGRTDIRIDQIDVPEKIDRTLATVTPSANADFWHGSGRAAVPTIREMVRELAAHR